MMMCFSFSFFVSFFFSLCSLWWSKKNRTPRRSYSAWIPCSSCVCRSFKGTPLVFCLFMHSFLAYLFLRQRERNLLKRFFPVFSFILHLLLRKQFSFSLLLLGRIPRRGWERERTYVFHASPLLRHHHSKKEETVIQGEVFLMHRIIIIIPSSLPSSLSRNVTWCHVHSFFMPCLSWRFRDRKKMTVKRGWWWRVCVGCLEN